MKRLIISLCSCVFLVGSPMQVIAADAPVAKALKPGFVSVRQCVEASKIGKAEQENFEKMKKQLEQAIEQKEKELNDMAPKFSDEFLDTLTPEAERELKEKFKNLSQDLSVQQNQYFQTLNQANFQVMQALLEQVTKASQAIAKKQGFDFILNDESSFYRDASFDITKDVIIELDQMFDNTKKAS